MEFVQAGTRSQNVENVASTYEQRTIDEKPVDEPLDNDPQPAGQFPS